ncbi:MAG: class I SAM-dependent methyltransferase [Anaerolineae bacterium]
MQESVAEKLLELNRRFYNQFAEAFSDSRGRTEPGFERVLAEMRPGERILDLGCGQGRLAYLVPAESPYVGVDYAESMLAVASERAEDRPGGALRFVEADLVADPWHESLDGPFDWIVLRAVLQHIPGYQNRQRVVRRAAQVLAPEGAVVMANWQFLQIERLRRRILPWSTIDLTEDDVEPGDYLLDWQRQGYGLRYVHLVDEAETARLASAAGLEISQMFRADGHTNDLTLYAILRKST